VPVFFFFHLVTRVSCSLRVDATDKTWGISLTAVSAAGKEDPRRSKRFGDVSRYAPACVIEALTAKFKKLGK
jgi:hypothetical protein